MPTFQYPPGTVPESPPDADKTITEVHSMERRGTEKTNEPEPRYFLR